MREMLSGSTRFNELRRGVPTTLVEVWRGDLPWPSALRTGAVTLQGPEHSRRAVPVWFPPARFAAVPRPEPRSEPAPV